MSQISVADHLEQLRVGQILSLQAGGSFGPDVRLISLPGPSGTCEVQLLEGKDDILTDIKGEVREVKAQDLVFVFTLGETIAAANVVQADGMITPEYMDYHSRTYLEALQSQGEEAAIAAALAAGAFDDRQLA